MKRIDVSSSTLESVGYDEATQSLEVAFRSGAVRQYHPVPMNAYRSLMGASKVGLWFYAYIQGVYPQTSLARRW